MGAIKEDEAGLTRYLAERLRERERVELRAGEAGDPGEGAREAMLHEDVSREIDSARQKSHVLRRDITCFTRNRFFWTGGKKRRG
jgi:hypothetical protein